MRIRPLLQVFAIVAVIGSAELAEASSVYVCGYFTPSTTCFTAGPCPDCEEVCTTDTSQPPCSWQELATTPVKVYRSHNAWNQHQYRTDTSLASGYVSDGVVFSLANDSAWGAVKYSYLNWGAGFYFSNPASIPNLVPLYAFTNPARTDALYTTDPYGGRAFPCTITGHPNGYPPTVDCYMPNSGPGIVIGYVGRP
jgi:hypothetical protein